MARRLTLHGASEEDAAQIRNLLRRAKSEIRSGWNLYAGDDTDLLIVDVDTVYGHMDWLRMLGQAIPVAALTRHTKFEDHDLILHKPVVMENLSELLQRAAEKTADRPESATIRAVRQPLRTGKTPSRTEKPDLETGAKHSPPADGGAPESSPSAVTQAPAQVRSLLEWITQGELDGHSWLQVDDLPGLLLDPGERQFYTSASLGALSPYCVMTISAAQWKRLDSEAATASRATLKAQPLSRLLWLCHASGSNGRPADGLDINAQHKLGRWPQIEREFPKHFRIATEMMKQPATLTEIAERSGAPLADVINFTNAYNAIGYIETQPLAAGDVDGNEAERGAIFSRLRKSLGNRQPG